MTTRQLLSLTIQIQKYTYTLKDYLYDLQGNVLPERQKHLTAINGFIKVQMLVEDFGITEKEAWRAYKAAGYP